MTIELFPTNWFFQEILYEVCHLQSWRVTSHEVIFARFFLFHGASNMCTNLFPNPFGQVVHNLHLVLRKKKEKEKEIHPNWTSYAKDIGS